MNPWVSPGSVASAKCPYCKDETPTACCYLTEDGSYWCPTNHHYVERFEIAQSKLTDFGVKV